MHSSAKRLVKAAACVALLFVASSVFAAGKGQTKIDFKQTVGDAASARIFFKLDVKSAVDTLPEVGSKSKNDNLAGYTVNLFMNGTLVQSGLANEKGKVPAPFDCKLTGNGKGMQIKLTGVDLVPLFPLDTAEGKNKTVTTAIKVTVTKADSAGVVTEEKVLNDQPAVTFTYSVKGTAVKGKNF